MALCLEERKGALQPSEGFKYGLQTQFIDSSEHKNPSGVERTTHCTFPSLCTVVQPNIGHSTAIHPNFNQFQVALVDLKGIRIAHITGPVDV